MGSVKRPCSVCGIEQARKKVWSKGKGRRVICMGCGPFWFFAKDGITVKRRTERVMAGHTHQRMLEC
jgi:hypothetical protein